MKSSARTVTRAGRSRRTGRPPTDTSRSCRFTNAVAAVRSSSWPWNAALNPTVPVTASASAPAASDSGCTSRRLTSAVPMNAYGARGVMVACAQARSLGRNIVALRSPSFANCQRTSAAPTRSLTPPLGVIDIVPEPPGTLNVPAPVNVAFTVTASTFAPGTGRVQVSPVPSMVVS